ncbi:MAG: hypothetical protein N3D11_17515, partial [Candidatus Sumerlaeia bacterium]|nr:hypothetical protein [Candidatus Sumerlaeia bacterium]
MNYRRLVSRKLHIVLLREEFYRVVAAEPAGKIPAGDQPAAGRMLSRTNPHRETNCLLMMAPAEICAPAENCRTGIEAEIFSGLQLLFALGDNMFAALQERGAICNSRGPPSGILHQATLYILASRHPTNLRKSFLISNHFPLT